MLLPIANSLTLWAKGVCQEMNGITFFVCSILWISMYSCSHFSDFLSDDQFRKQSAMLKRGQKTTSNEGSPTAKAKPYLVLPELRSEEISSRSFVYLVNPEYADEEKKSYKHPSCRKWWEKNILTSHVQGNLLRYYQNWGIWNTRTINTWARPFIFSKEIGNVRN